MMELFCEIVFNGLLTTIFAKKLHRRCSAGFKMRLWGLNAPFSTEVVARSSLLKHGSCNNVGNFPVIYSTESPSG